MGMVGSWELNWMSSRTEDYQSGRYIFYWDLLEPIYLMAKQVLAKPMTYTFNYDIIINRIIIIPSPTSTSTHALTPNS